MSCLRSFRYGLCWKRVNWSNETDEKLLTDNDRQNFDQEVWLKLIGKPRIDKHRSTAILLLLENNVGSYTVNARSPPPSQRPAPTTTALRSPFLPNLCSCSTSLSKMKTNPRDVLYSKSVPNREVSWYQSYVDTSFRVVWSISIPRSCFVDLKIGWEWFYHIISICVKQALVDQIFSISIELTGCVIVEADSLTLFTAQM